MKKFSFLVLALSLLVLPCCNSQNSDKNWISIPGEYVAFSCSLDLNGGTTTLTSPMIRDHNTIQSIAKPTKENAEFLGWSPTLDTSQAVITFPFEIPEDNYLLIAHYSHYKITFLGQDKTSVLSTKYVQIGMKASAPLQIANIDHWNYYFGENSDNVLNNTPFDFSTLIYQDYTLVPIYKDISKAL